MFTKIPKTAFFYWEGEGFSYLHYLSLKSFLYHNPDWTCNVYTNKEKVQCQRTPWKGSEQKTLYTGKDYFHLVKDLPLNVIEFDFKSINVSPKLSPVFKSDILRWHLLSTQGGAWIDTDILHLKPLESLSKYININCDVCYVDNGIEFIIGFMMASPNNPYYNAIYEVSRLQKKCDYQMFGNKIPKMLKLCGYEPMLTKNLNVHNLHMGSFYPYEWFECDNLFMKNTSKVLDDSVVGVHWFNGSSQARKFCNIFDEGYNKERPTTDIERIVTRVQKDILWRKTDA